jgi:hypothetical protein
MVLVVQFLICDSERRQYIKFIAYLRLIVTTRRYPDIKSGLFQQRFYVRVVGVDVLCIAYLQCNFGWIWDATLGGYGMQLWVDMGCIPGRIRDASLGGYAMHRVSTIVRRPVCLLGIRLYNATLRFWCCLGQRSDSIIFCRILHCIRPCNSLSSLP